MKNGLLEVADNIENIKASISFLFFADKAIHRLTSEDNYHISDIDLIGMENVKDLVLAQLSSLSDEIIEIEKGLK